MRISDWSSDVCSSDLTGSGGSGAIRVPTTAVQSFEGKSVVFVRTPTGFKATPVQLGDASGDTVIVRSGLTGNEQIPTTGSFPPQAEVGKGEASPQAQTMNPPILHWAVQKRRLVLGT